MAQSPLTSPSSSALWTHILLNFSFPPPCFSLTVTEQAANIPLVCELGIDKLSFDDFSLDVDAMITAALRMFMELGMVQKFKIDYEVRPPFFLCPFPFVHLTEFTHSAAPLISSPRLLTSLSLSPFRHCADGCWLSEKTTGWSSTITGDMRSMSASACLPC